MDLRRFLFTLFAALIAIPAFGQSLAKTFTLTAANQCALIGTSQLPTVGIDVSGTFSLTLTPYVVINGQTKRASQVTPSSSNTAQATITTAGGYTDPFVGGYDTFLLCVTSYSSGSAVVWLNPSAAVNASLLSGGGSSGGVSTFPAGFTSLNAFGDSITAGTVIPQPTQVYAQLLASDVGLGEALTNNGVGGAHLNQAGFAPTILAASTSSTYASVTLYGAKDLAEFNANAAAGQAQIIAFVQELNIFLGLPASQKVLASAMTQGGSWLHNGDFTSYDRYSSTNGNSLTGTVTGSTVYVGMELFPSGATSIFDVLVDGVSTSGGTGYSLTNVITGSGLAGNNSLYGMRFPGYSSGSHTVEILVGAASGFVQVQFIGGNGSNPANLPWAWSGGPLPSTGNSATSWNTQQAAACALLVTDGLQVAYVNSGLGMSLAATHPLQFIDGLHPSLYGNYLVAQNFLNTVYPNGLGTEALTALLQAAAFGNWSGVPATSPPTFAGIAFDNFSATATGGSGTLPSQPVAFLTFQTGSSTFKIPYYQ